MEGTTHGRRGGAELSAARGHYPFFLAAAGFAALALAWWLAELQGWLPSGRLPLSRWHGHEMIFGHLLAVLSGFC